MKIMNDISDIYNKHTLKDNYHLRKVMALGVLKK